MAKIEFADVEVECKEQVEALENQLQFAESIVKRLIEHLDEYAATPMIGRKDPQDPSTEFTFISKEWLEFECFSKDHLLYDDILAFCGNSKWKK